MDELQYKIGKFSSPEQLLKAYETLEAEFTVRSQRLKELAKENQELKTNLNDTERLDGYAKSALSRDEFVEQNVLTNEQIKNRVIKDYLTLLSSGSASPLSGGKSVLTPPPRPKSLSEAKRLADLLINN